MQRDELYYFAHPYTIKDKNKNNVHGAQEANFNLCCIRTAELLKKGYKIYSPIVHSHPIHIRDPKFLKSNEYKLWIELDKAMINKTKFDGIILAPEWRTSKGCMNEYKEFRKKGSKILFYEDIIKEE